MFSTCDVASHGQNVSRRVAFRAWRLAGRGLFEPAGSKAMPQMGDDEHARRWRALDNE
jgi:hypothetical protein